MQSLNYEITTLDNGIRVITETVNHVQFFSMGIWVGVGSRYEAESQWGITHFIEHMMFKGTEKRTAEEISKAIDEVGGQLNAFTSKENTCYYVKTLTEHFPLAVDVLFDMFLNSKFDNVPPSISVRTILRIICKSCLTKRKGAFLRSMTKITSASDFF